MTKLLDLCLIQELESALFFLFFYNENLFGCTESEFYPGRNVQEGKATR